MTKEERPVKISRIFTGHEDLLKLEVPSLKELRAMRARGELVTKTKL